MKNKTIQKIANAFFTDYRTVEESYKAGDTLTKKLYKTFAK